MDVPNTTAPWTWGRTGSCTGGSGVLSVTGAGNRPLRYCTLADNGDGTVDLFISWLGGSDPALAYGQFTGQGTFPLA